METNDSKYYKIFSGKTILWPWPLSTFEKNLNECQNWPFSGSIVSPRKALDRPFKLQSILYNLVCKLTLMYKVFVTRVWMK